MKSRAVTFTAPRGESWRCQAICASGRRCTWAAVWQADHPVHRLTMRACWRHKQQIEAGATIHVNSSLGVDTKPATCHGGPFDGDVIGVPWDLRGGDTWFMEIADGATHEYLLAAHDSQPGFEARLYHVGLREDPAAKPISSEQVPP